MTTQPQTQVVAPVPGGIDKLLKSENIYKRFEAMMGQRTPQFLSSLISLVNGSKGLKDADPMSIVASAAMAASLDLPINPGLAFAHIVPYRDNKNGGKMIGQFQMGWRGFVQLGQRTALYKAMNAAVVYEGELVKADEFRGVYEFDHAKKTSDKVIGYVFYFALLNGFEKWFYWTREKCEAHGKRYSQSFKKGYGMWVDNFDAMALKTVTKLALSKYGPMSIDVQRAVRVDQAVAPTLEIALDPSGAALEFPDNPEGTETDAPEKPEAEPVAKSEKK